MNLSRECYIILALFALIVGQDLQAKDSIPAEFAAQDSSSIEDNKKLSFFKASFGGNYDEMTIFRLNYDLHIDPLNYCLSYRHG